MGASLISGARTKNQILIFVLTYCQTIELSSGGGGGGGGVGGGGGGGGVVESLRKRWILCSLHQVAGGGATAIITVTQHRGGLCKY